ncbi:MAG: bifunctional (p)ppGpp synthetase/guanosine-3',5'-bis(diphosphate) 3'-pyrophosphohydrolase [Flavobacteriaceae bacterium]|nr:bifunctional (p)ppGpp synthetase/guanosine-3',5'-bis(diphosphate) 3'-pyrophosphohydrolase [Flavobacteriaceae bacterium]
MGYNVSIEEENKNIAAKYKDLLKESYQTLSKEGKDTIRRAFDLAIEAHKSQRRKSGEPYIYHPIAVAKIVAYEIGLGSTAISAALLHDVVEDTDYTEEDINERFGPKIASLVAGLTKMSHLNSEQDTSLQAENFRKMLLTLNEDVRVILVKIADRLHNMQTLSAMKPDKQVKIASETLYIYAPLAHRLGLYNIKTELEDLGLKYTEPDIYNEIEAKVKADQKDQEDYITSFKDKVQEHLDAENLDYTILGRTKSIYSINRKIQKQGVSFEEVLDRFAIRIVYKSTPKLEKFDAWRIYSIITEYFRPNPTRLRDWISQPKTTGYEALHTTVMGPGAKWVEVQIRSERMNEIAEKGFAAHFKYKQGKIGENGLTNWLNKLKETIENKEISAIDFVEDFKLNLYSKEIFVFTPKGDLKALPKNATALDFAFSVHTEIGLKCSGAKVNGKMVQLNHVLKNGDQVSVTTSINKRPNIRWLNFVVTARAKTKIKSTLKEEEKEIAEQGKALLIRKLKHLKISFNENELNKLVAFAKEKTSFALFYKAGIGAIENSLLKEFANQRGNVFLNYFKSKIRKVDIPRREITDVNTDKNSSLVFGKEKQKLDYSKSKCCNPIPGDKVFGFTTIKEGLKIHKYNCPNAISLQSNYAYRIIEANWDAPKEDEYRIILKISGLDNIGILNHITNIISKKMKINIYSLNISTERGLFGGNISIGVFNNFQLDKVIDVISAIDGVKNVKRVV